MRSSSNSIRDHNALVRNSITITVLSSESTATDASKRIYRIDTNSIVANARTLLTNYTKIDRKFKEISQDLHAKVYKQAMYEMFESLVLEHIRYYDKNKYERWRVKQKYFMQQKLQQAVG